MSVIERIETLFLWRGRWASEHVPGGRFSAAEHALQAAHLAEQDGAAASLVAAALVHDIGQLLPLPPGADPVDDVHELRSVAFLAEAFSPAVLEPVRHHVQAKRYLVAADATYRRHLSPAAANSLDRQGGAMTAFEMRLFEALPFAADALQLRLYDDRARVQGLATPPLGHYIGVLKGLARRGEPVLAAA